MDSPSQDPKLSLMQLPSMDDDGGFSDNHSPIHRFTAVLTPDVHGVFSPKVLIPGVAIERPPKIRITLLSRKLVTYVLGTCIFLGVFTGVAYHGIEVYTKTQDSNDVASTEAVDAKVELFNAISGFLIALVEVMLGVYMSNFLPAFQVYLHNMLWFLHGGVAATKFSNGMRSFLMFVFPVFLMLVIGQCLRSFQASQSSVGFETIMLMDDLSLDQSVIDILKDRVDGTENDLTASMKKANTTRTTPRRVTLQVLKAAVKGTAIPLDVTAKSNCSSEHGELRIGLNDFDSANVAYGFPAQEWYSEMLDLRLNTTSESTLLWADAAEAVQSGVTLERPDFDLVLASDMYANAKIVLDRMVAESTIDYTECGTYDTDELIELLDAAKEAKTVGDKLQVKCQGSYRTLYEIGNFQSKVENQLPEVLAVYVGASLQIAVDGLDATTTSIDFRRSNLTDQAQIHTMVIEADIALNKTNSPFFETKSSEIYEFGDYAQDLCGSENCVFVDTNNNLELPRQVLMVPYRTNCKYDKDSIKYVRDVRSFMPADCEIVPNSVLVISITSFIMADWYGSDLSEVDPELAPTPGLQNPWRRLRLAITKIDWQTESFTDRFSIDEVRCRRENGKCKGLSYRLTKTGRYVFVGEDSLPTQQIMSASLAAPIHLVQLNPARFFIGGLDLPTNKQYVDQQVTPERLTWKFGDSYYDGWDWTKSLERTDCSRFMDAYIRHIEENALYLERPNAVLYRSAMFYLFSNASVTELNDTQVVLDAAQGNTSLDDQIEAQSLFNLKLKGDMQYRDIKVRVPKGTFLATIVVCALLLVIALVVVAFPKRPMEYFAPTASTPDKYIVLMNAEKYPDIVHTKTLLFPATGESLPMEDFDVDEMTLVNHTDQSDEITFWDWGALAASWR